LGGVVMTRWLRRRVTAGSFDEVACWTAACALIAACTVLSLLMLPSLDRWLVALVSASVTAGWCVMAWMIGRKMMRI
jgi:hypothetical protein